MRCPVHVATEMELTEVKAPAWLLMQAESDDGEEAGGYHHNKHDRTRKFWKCPQPGCRRVAAHSVAEESKERACSKCGGKSDGPVCSHCLLEASQQRAAANSARRARGEKKHHRRPSVIAQPRAIDFAETPLDAWRRLPAKRDEIRAD